MRFTLILIVYFVAEELGFDWTIGKDLGFVFCGMLCLGQDLKEIFGRRRAKSTKIGCDASSADGQSRTGLLL